MIPRFLARLFLPILFTMTMLTSTTASAADGGFLFVTFKGEQTPVTYQRVTLRRVAYQFACPQMKFWRTNDAGIPQSCETFAQRSVYSLMTSQRASTVVLAGPLGTKLQW